MSKFCTKEHFEKYTFGDVIESNKYSTLRDGRINDNELCVFKISSYDYFLNLHELKMYKKINNRCPYICHLVDNFVYDEKLYIVLNTHDDSIDLFDYVFTYGNLYHSKLINIILECANGIKFLHDNNICHFDIKPENIIVYNITDIPSSYIIDLGFSLLLKEESKLSSSYGTSIYMSPEMINNGYVYKESDIFSLGIMIYVIFFPKICSSSDLINQSDKYGKNYKFHPTKNLKFNETIIDDEEINKVYYKKKLVNLINNCIYNDKTLRYDIDEVIVELKTIQHELLNL